MTKLHTCNRSLSCIRYVSETKGLFLIPVKLSGNEPRHTCFPLTNEAVLRWCCYCAYGTWGVHTADAVLRNLLHGGERVPAFPVPLRSPRSTVFPPGTGLADIGMGSGVFHERGRHLYYHSSQQLHDHEFYPSPLSTQLRVLQCGFVVTDIQRDYWGTIRAHALLFIICSLVFVSSVQYIHKTQKDEREA